jgi:hypothetical protein
MIECLTRTGNTTNYLDAQGWVWLLPAIALRSFGKLFPGWAVIQLISIHLFERGRLKNNCRESDSPYSR